MRLSSLDPALAGPIIALLALLVGVLTYRLNIANRKSSLAMISADWKTTYKILASHEGHELADMMLFFECLFTNIGGRSTAITGLLPIEGAFVRYWRTFIKEKVRNELFDKPFRCFLCSKPVVDYLTNETLFKFIEGTELKLPVNSAEVPLNVVLEPGKSMRFTLCFWFPQYVKKAEAGYNTIIAFELVFNNGQTFSMNQSVEKELTLGKH